MNNIKVAILWDGQPNSVEKWVNACEKFEITYVVINILGNDWIDKVNKETYAFYLLRPPGNYEPLKRAYDERIYILSEILSYKLVPSFKECYVYENKKLLSDYLKAKNIPHPVTNVFYNKDKALDFIQNSELPVVVKTSIGASGAGVNVLRTKKDAVKYIKKAFTKGIRRRIGPNRSFGTPKKWLIKAFNSPSYFLKKIKQYTKEFKYKEKGYVIFQEYIPHDFEWRSVKIGESFFAHKKTKQGDKASGTKGIDYVKPPESLLNFTKSLCEDNNFNYMAVDIFETRDGGYLVNELQSIFGHVQDYILEVDGKPGRYIFIDNKWMFEPGNFNTNESYDLRLKTALLQYANIKL